MRGWQCIALCGAIRNTSAMRLTPLITVVGFVALNLSAPLVHTRTYTHTLFLHCSILIMSMDSSSRVN